MSELISDLRKAPVVRSVIPFIFGLLIADQGGVESSNSILKAVLFLMACMISLQWLDRKRRCWGTSMEGIMFAVLFMLLGILHYTVSRNFRVDEDILNRQEGLLEGIVRYGAVQKKHSWLVEVRGTAFINDSLQLRLDEFVQVYLPAGANVQDLLPGEHLLVFGKMDRIRNHGNPFAFDYTGYMSRKRTRFNLFVREPGYFKTYGDENISRGYGPARLRRRIINGWNPTDPEVAVLSALTLGYRSLLDRDTKSAFSDAGAMHLLAVSGLHVGMIWWILEQLIRVPSGSLLWRRFKLILIIAVLWGYAAVTGFSDSVTRSVTMFSMLSLARAIQRNSNIYNTLLLSAFLLLVMKPSRIMEPGFQLSYLAVSGIVTIQPQLEKMYAGVHWILRKILDLVSVSIAAQLSTLPLVLTYFHQFPAWFLLTNLTAIPMVSIILALFVLFVPFLVFYPEWHIFSQILLWCAGVLNKLVTGIASLPGAVIHDLMPDPAVMLLFAGILLTTCMFVYYKGAYFLGISLLLFSMTLFVPIVRDRQMEGQSSITIFNTKDGTLVSHLHDSQRVTFFLQSDSVPDPYTLAYVQSLAGSPPGVRSQRMVRMEASDTTASSDRCRIADELWAVRWGDLNMLIAGACDRRILAYVVRSFNWQIIVCRRGIPVVGLRKTLDQWTGRLVGDGTLREYEMTALAKQFPAIWLTGSKGAWVLQQEKDVLPLSDFSL